MIYLAAAQVHVLQPNKLTPFTRGGVRLTFIRNLGYTHTIVQMPFIIQLTPKPSKLGQKFIDDLLLAKVDLERLPTDFNDMDLLPLAYPLSFPDDWLVIINNYHTPIRG